jgi:hypothetical protein
MGIMWWRCDEPVDTEMTRRSSYVSLPLLQRASPVHGHGEMSLPPLPLPLGSPTTTNPPTSLASISIPASPACDTLPSQTTSRPNTPSPTITPCSSIASSSPRRRYASASDESLQSSSEQIYREGVARLDISELSAEARSIVQHPVASPIAAQHSDILPRDFPSRYTQLIQYYVVNV